MTASERVMRARVAAHSRWAREPDYSAATAPARAVLDKRFVDEVTAAALEHGVVLNDEELARRVAHARKAYFSSLALKSAQARRRRAS